MDNEVSVSGVQFLLALLFGENESEGDLHEMRGRRQQRAWDQQSAQCDHDKSKENNKRTMKLTRATSFNDCEVE